VNIVGIILWVIVIWLAVSFSWYVRRTVLRGTGLMIQTANFTLLLVVQILVARWLDINPLHFFWMVPLAFVIGQMSILFPISLLSPIGRLYISFCCLGLDKEDVRQNTNRFQFFRELVTSGYSQGEAVEMAKERFPVR
jgi:hypothetical protein